MSAIIPASPKISSHDICCQRQTAVTTYCQINSDCCLPLHDSTVSLLVHSGRSETIQSSICL